MTTFLDAVMQGVGDALDGRAIVESPTLQPGGESAFVVSPGDKVPRITLLARVSDRAEFAALLGAAAIATLIAVVRLAFLVGG